MKQQIYEPTLFLRDGKEWIKGYTIERPKVNPATTEYISVMNKFLASAVEHPVCEGSIGNIYFSANEIWKKKHVGNISSQIEHSNFRIDELADRLEVFEIGVLHREKQIRLRPEVKEESQEELWADILDTIERTPSNELIKLFKQQFTIKRNK